MNSALFLMYYYAAGASGNLKATSILSRWTLLKAANFSHNLLNGGLPEELSQWSELEYLDLHDNFINGTLPELYATSWENLRGMDLSDTLISGQVPTEWCHSDAEMVINFTCSEILCGCDCSCLIR